MIKGVIFDMDGTMFDTENLSTVTWGLTAKKLDMPMPLELIDSFRGRNRKAIRELFQEYHKDNFIYDEVIKIKHRFMWEIIDRDGVPVKKGLYELLEYLHQEGIKIAIATSTEKERSEEFMRRTNILHYFDAAVYGPEVAKSKPEPDIFIEAAKRMHLLSKECLVVEDSINGLLAGKAAGGAVILIPDVVKVPEDVKCGISAELEDLSQIIGWIQKENTI